MDDAELLTRYADHRDEAAFAELVRRHLDLVHSAALRQCRGEPDAAADVSQRVFTALAAKARALRSHPCLSGWLYKTTRYSALDAMRNQNRRQALLREVAQNADLVAPPDPEPDWDLLRPLLDDAMAGLGERDRRAVLLRFFEKRSFADVGRQLGLGENAARMRVERALEKLRALLERRGLRSSAAALAALLVAHAIDASPAGLSSTVSTAALASAAAGAGGLAGLVSAHLMPNLATTLLSAGVSAVVAASVVWFLPKPETREIALVSLENARLRVLQTRQESEIQDLKRLAARLGAPLPAQAGKAAASAQPKASDSAVASARGLPYQNLGQSTAYDAYQTFAWASDRCDVATLSKLVAFEPEGRVRAAAMLAKMPENIREQYKTPEELYAFLIAADALRYPPPGAALLLKAVADPVGDDRVLMHLPGSTRRGHTYVRTAEGWKYLFPNEAIEGFPSQFTNDSQKP